MFSSVKCSTDYVLSSDNKIIVMKRQIKLTEATESLELINKFEIFLVYFNQAQNILNGRVFFNLFFDASMTVFLKLARSQIL